MMRWNRGLRACYCYAEFADEPVAGFYEGEVVIVLDEADGVAALATDEAHEDILFLVDMQRGVLVIVIPALGTAGVAACAV